MPMSMPSLSHPKFSLSWWIGKNYFTLTFQSTSLQGLVPAHSIMVFYIYKWFSPKCLKIHIYFKWINAYWMCTLCWALCLPIRTKRWIRGGSGPQGGQSSGGEKHINKCLQYTMLNAMLLGFKMLQKKNDGLLFGESTSF